MGLDYSRVAFPKPVTKKKKKKCNGWKDKPDRVCYYCRTFGAERHEVYPGNPRRQISIDNGFQVDLCHGCHEEIQIAVTERGQQRKEYWQQHFQKEYEEKLITSGISEEKARNLWMSLMDRNYL